jgi:6-phosphogluconolactonase
MRTKIVTVLLLLSACLCGKSANSGDGKNSPVKSECYIYVSVNKEKKIAIYKLVAEKDELSFIGIQKLAGEPGSLCSDPTNKNIYAALRDQKSVATLHIDKKSGRTRLIKETPVIENPVYISTDIIGKYLFFTSYSGNMSAVYPLEKGGVNKDAVQIIQARVNPHMIKTDASGKFLFVTNKGGDVIQQFIFQSNGVLQEQNQDMVKVKTGSGPRHFTFHPSLNVMYVVNELSCTILAFNFNSINGTLSGPFQEISTKPADHVTYNTCADIHITPDGRFLFASNRGHDSLAGYRVDNLSGELTLTGYYPTEKEPREFEIDPSGRYVISAGESSGRIALYTIQTNGSLSMIKTYETGKWPVWVMALEF